MRTGLTLIIAARLILGAASPSLSYDVPDTLPTAVARAMAQGHLQARSDGGGGVIAGPLFPIASIRVASAPGFTAEALGISAYEGQPASAANLDAIGSLVRGFLFDHGHPFAEIALDFSGRKDGPGIDLRIDIRAGKGFKYGGMKYTGSHIRPHVLERLSLLRYGEPYSETRVRRALEKLGRTGYFEAIVPGRLFRDSLRNILYPSLTLADLKGNRLSGILGYDSEKKAGEGVNGYLDIHLINLRGTARDLDFTFSSKTVGQGAQEKEVKLDYVEPWLLGTSVGGRFNGQIALEDSVYDERSGEIVLFQDLDFRSRYQVSFAQQYNHDYRAQTRSSAEIAGLGLLYDARDRVPGTLRGARVSARVNGVWRDLGDSSYFLVQSLNELALWGNAGRWVGHMLLSGSGNWPLEGRSNRGELYALGGANSMRGFREKEFLTNLFAYANLELQFLLAPRSRAVLFAVPALVNRLEGDVHWMRKIGYGAGMELGSKDWVFGLSYALNPDRAWGDGFVHMRVINNF